MKLFSKKEKIILYSELQKDTMLERLENAKVNYDIREDRFNYPVDNPAYIIRVDASDYKKVV